MAAADEMFSSRGEGNTLKMEPYRLMTSAERYTVEQFFQEHSGLRRQQFASNPWGFPFIPLPYPRSGNSSQPRIAPDSVNNSWLGHPIYWIDPILTKHDPDVEPEDMWCMRMFFLIQSFGLWNDEFQWIDMLDGIEYEEADIRSYHQASSPVSALDQIKILDESDMLISYDEYMDSYVASVAKCTEALVEENESVIRRQEEAYNTAIEIVVPEGQDPKTVSVTHNDTNGFWDRNILPYLTPIVNEYEKRMNGTTASAISDLSEPVNQYFGYLEDTIIAMNKVAAILTIPVLKSVNPDPVSFGYLASYIGVAVDTVSSKNDHYKFREESSLALSTGRASGALTQVYKNGEEEYKKAWRRVRIALSNFDRVQSNEEPFTTFAALEAHYGTITTQNESSDDTIRKFDNMFGEIQ